MPGAARWPRTYGPTHSATRRRCCCRRRLMAEQQRRTLSETVDELTAGTVTSAELVDAALRRATDLHRLGAFQTRFDDAARAAAAAIDKWRRPGDATRPLAGVPVAVKDLLATGDGPT